MDNGVRTDALAADSMWSLCVESLSDGCDCDSDSHHSDSHVHHNDQRACAAIKSEMTDQQSRVSCTQCFLQLSLLVFPFSAARVQISEIGRHQEDRVGSRRIAMLREER